jgi:multidrug efflux pump subunit AcrA (membrane-fusion protein)
VLGTSGARTVYVVENGKAERRAVRVGPEANGQVEVLEGVQVGDTVIVTGATEVREGAEVRIVQPLAPDVTPGSPPRQAPAADTTQPGGKR